MAKQEIVPSIDATIQSRVKSETDTGIGLVLWLASGNELIPPWWSKRRDVDLRSFWKRVDYLSGAIYTLESRMTTIPFKVVPKDNSIEAHVRQAARFEDMLNDGSEFGAGWVEFFGKWIEDMLTQDNGLWERPSVLQTSTAHVAFAQATLSSRFITKTKHAANSNCITLVLRRPR